MAPTSLAMGAGQPLASPSTIPPRRAAVAAALACLATVTGAVLAGGDSRHVPTPEPLAVASDYGQLPLAFEPNAGRHDESLDYVTASAAGSVALGERGLVLSDGAERITVGLPGAMLERPHGLARLPGVVNDLRGADPDAWRAGIPTFERVRYAEAYPGVDIDFHGTRGALEYDFRVAAGADPSPISMDLSGADSVRLGRRGDLIVREGTLRVRQQAPFAYQRTEGGTAPVRSAFSLDGRTVSFELGRYDRSLPLVIDPLVLVYSTYLGGTDFDNAEAIAVDASGSAYIAGLTASTDFDTVGPIAGDAPQADAFVAKLNPAGSALVYSTYLGGDAVDGAAGIAVDATGSAYVTGETQSTNFPTVGAIEGDSGAADAFVAKLNPAGSALVYSTYLGGSLYESPFAIAVDGSGSAYVTGETLSPDFNTVAPIEGPSGQEDVFVSKLNPAGSALVYSTYLGGGAGDGATGIAVDGSGAAFIAGLTGSTNFDTVGAIEGDSPSTDAFVAKLAPAGSSLLYSTYLGGGASEIARGVAVDPAGAAYVTGHTDSTDFDTVNAFEANSAATDVFVSKLNPAGSSLAYSTYLGGSEIDRAEGIAVDGAGSAYLTGRTESEDFDELSPLSRHGNGPPRAPAPGLVPAAFVTKLAPAGSALAYSTLIGGTADEDGKAIALDSAGSAYVLGQTRSSDFPLVGPIEGDSPGNDDNLFIAKLDGTAPETAILKGPKRKVKTKKRRAKVRFLFASSEPGSSFACKLDKGQFQPCVSPVRRKVKKGRHNFQVFATDPAAIADASPAAHQFKVKRKKRKRRR
jgi:hypothetical protein